MNLLVARGKDLPVNLVSAVREGPVGAIWGGGHNNRAGLHTGNVKRTGDEAVVADWWGPDRDPQKVLGFVAQQIEKQRGG